MGKGNTELVKGRTEERFEGGRAGSGGRESRGTGNKGYAEVEDTG